jgi:membrane-associated phospholipid phosphatase
MIDKNKEHLMQDLQPSTQNTVLQRRMLFSCCVLFPLLLLTFLTSAFIQHQVFDFDLPLMWQIHQFANPVYDCAAITMSYLGGMPVASMMFVAMLIYAHQFRSHQILFMLISMVGVANLSWLLKALVNRPRPMLWPRLVQDYGASFPSGHSVYAAAFACVFIILSWRTRWRGIVWVFSIAWMLLMGLSRIYLGVHYPSDVLGGWALGWAWVFFVYLGLNKAPK